MKLIPSLIVLTGILLAISGVTLYYYLVHPDSRPGADDIRARPVVLRTDKEYLNESIYSAGSGIHKKFGSEYTTNNFSKALQSEIIKDMVKQANALGLDGNVLRLCLNATGIFQDNGTARLPCYAEYARYNGTPCWVITMNWEYWDRSRPHVMGHIQNYLIDARTCEVLKFETCD